MGAATIIRRTVTVAYADGLTYARANVWTERGYSSKTFLTPKEASDWLPASARKTTIPAVRRDKEDA